MPRHWETTRPFFLSAPRSAFAASRWCSLPAAASRSYSLPAGCFPCRRLLRFPLPMVFHGALCQSASVPPASNSFPMLPHSLPCRVSSGAATLPHRLPLSSIPPQRFACGSSHSRGHGRPRSVRKRSRLRGKCLSMDCICSDRPKSVGPSATIAYATSVSPPDKAAARQVRRYWMLDEAGALPMSLHR